MYIKGSRLINFVLVLGALILTSKAHAFHLDGNGFYFTDTFVLSGTTNYAYTAADVSLNLDIDKKGYWTIGWSYLMLANTTKTASDTATFSTSEMGPRISWFLDKQKAWGLGVVYNLIANATYQDSSLGSVKWRGTSIKADFGYTAAFGDSFFLGGRINYYSASWVEQIVGETTYSKITYTRGWIYPALYFRWQMD